MSSYAVLGATSWGLTLAWQLAGNGHRVTVVTRDTPEAVRIREKRTVLRLPELELPDSVEVQPATAIAAGFEGLVVAVPAQHVSGSVAELNIDRRVPVLSAAKGIEFGTRRRMSGVLAAAGWPRELVTVLSGPNLAHEVARGLPAAAVVASYNEAEAERWQGALSGGAYRVYRAGDVVGVELGGALKNVIAIAAGACVGLGLGANAVATLMTRGLAEITRLGVALGAEPATFQGLAGVGDLAATCYSPLSRNQRLGQLLAAGKTPAEAEREVGETVEGAATAPVALELAAEAGVEMPITAQVVAVLNGDLSVAEAMASLLSRSLKSESH